MTASPGEAARDRATLVAVMALGSSLQQLEDAAEVRGAVALGTARLLDADVTLWSVVHEPVRGLTALTTRPEGVRDAETPANPTDAVRDAMRTGVPTLLRSDGAVRGLVAPYAVLSRTGGVLEVRAREGHRDLDAGDLAACLAVGERLGSELGARRIRDDYRYRAERDQLTGLPNRFAFLLRLHEAVAAAEQGGPSPTVVFLDVDQFKLVNDSLGHDAGDAVLRAVARRLSAELREEDVVARFGGDEFVVLIRGDLAEPELNAVLGRLTGREHEPVVVLGQRVFVTLSAGLIRHRPGAGAATLLSRADAAMFQAKSAGGRRWREYDEGLQELASARLRDRTELRDALRNGQLFCVFQPIVDTASGEVVAHESLVRWAHPHRGVLGPDEFLPTAEDDGLMLALTRQVLALSLRAAATWPASVSVTVNVSASLVADTRLLQAVADQLAESRVQPGRLVVEITETAVMRDRDRAMDHLDALHRTGVRIAVDDFGTGFTSVEDLLRMPLDILKIDREFVAQAGTAEGRAMLGALEALARAVGVPAVAEGVESAEMLAAVRLAGCPLAQGYLLGRPVPPDQVRHSVPGALRPEAGAGDDADRERGRD